MAMAESFGRSDFSEFCKELSIKDFRLWKTYHASLGEGSPIKGLPINRAAQRVEDFLGSKLTHIEYWSAFPYLKEHDRRFENFLSNRLFQKRADAKLEHYRNGGSGLKLGSSNKNKIQ